MKIHYTTQEQRDLMMLQIVRRGNQQHFRASDLTEQEFALLKAKAPDWLAFPRDGVELNARFKRARLLVGYHWDNPKAHYCHAVKSAQ